MFGVLGDSASTSQNIMTTCHVCVLTRKFTSGETSTRLDAVGQRKESSHVETTTRRF